MATIKCNNKKSINAIILGTIGAAYGVRGWLKIRSSTAKAENIFSYQPWFVKQFDQWNSIWLENWKQMNQNWIVKIREIKDRETALLFNNLEIFVNISSLPKLNEDEYYWKDLIGCQVVTVDGYQLGEVVNLIETGSHDVLVVKAHLQDVFSTKERLIPFLDNQVIKNVDLATRFIKIEWDPSF
ncbi:ribosome maturation factor RimM [Candidatus Curculioniphilus buchneri]|uniref:ribosome maturation factor RimM n=1 Tax=Candidatus Curculioniphilus buchneri TaxID=690594 RepID=UPI00376F2DC9